MDKVIILTLLSIVLFLYLPSKKEQFKEASCSYQSYDEAEVLNLRIIPDSVYDKYDSIAFCHELNGGIVFLMDIHKDDTIWTAQASDDKDGLNKTYSIEDNTPVEAAIKLFDHIKELNQ